MDVTRRFGTERAKPRAGAAAELAVVLPVLVVLMLGCVDLGRFAYQYAAVHNAARAGAAYAINHPFRTPAEEATWKSNIVKAAQDEIGQQANINKLTVTPTWVAPTQTSMGHVEVTVTYPFKTLALIPWSGIPTTVTLKGSVVMWVVR